MNKPRWEYDVVWAPNEIKVAIFVSITAITC